MGRLTDAEFDQIGDEMNDLLDDEMDEMDEVLDEVSGDAEIDASGVLTKVPKGTMALTERSAKIPAWVKEEFDAFLQVMSSMGAEGLTSKFCVIAMEPQFDQGFDEVVYAFAARVSETFIPLFVFEQGLKKWLPIMNDDSSGPVMYQMRHAPSAEEILARIPDDALTSFEDPDFLVTAEDVNEDEFE